MQRGISVDLGMFSSLPKSSATPLPVEELGSVKVKKPCKPVFFFDIGYKILSGILVVSGRKVVVPGRETKYP
jgi:hypothetical protein